MTIEEAVAKVRAAYAAEQAAFDSADAATKAAGLAEAAVSEATLARKNAEWELMVLARGVKELRPLHLGGTISVA